MSETITFQVQGMGCQACVSAVEKAVRSVDAVAQVAVDLKTGMVQITGATVLGAAIIVAIAAAGYDSVS